MKKFLALILSLVMALSLAACGGNEDTPTEEEGQDAGTEETAASDVKVGFIFLHDENSTYDLNFLNAARLRES